LRKLKDSESMATQVDLTESASAQPPSDLHRLREILASPQVRAAEARARQLEAQVSALEARNEQLARAVMELRQELYRLHTRQTELIAQMRAEARARDDDMWRALTAPTA
jgi:predicted RNase H-like nuclease (RuvC/YqgF family)